MRANIVNDQTLISRAFIPSGLVLPIRKGSDDARALQTVAENEELKNKLRNLQEENVKLQAVITDLTQVNKRWQKYNNDRQIYVQKLLNTIQDQQEQLNKIGELRAFPSTEVQTDNSKDNKNSVMLKQEVIRFQESERRLKEKIEVLEFQVKANRDDWEAEHNEKKQAVKEKEEIEQRVNLLMNELQEVKHSILEKRLPKHTLTICSSCQARFPNSSHSNDQIPVHSKLYRTAVHLPCSSQQWNNDISSKSPTNSIFSDLEIDGKDGNDNDHNINCSNSSSKCSSHHNISNSSKYNKSEENIKLNSSQNNKVDDDQCSISSSICSFKGNTECDKRNNVTDIWNIGRSSSASDSSVKHELGVSYSRASTVPLINSPIKQLKTPSNSSSTSSVALTTVEPLNNEPVTYEFSTNGGATVTSFMKIPVVKSSSAPDSKSENSIKPFKLPLDSFNMSSSSSSNPPITFINSPSDFLETNTEDENVDDVGIETLTREDIICPGCGAIFPPNMHLKFLDHFESCQRINNL